MTAGIDYNVACCGGVVIDNHEDHGERKVREMLR